MRILSALLLFTAVSAQLLPPDLDLTVHEGSGQDTDSGGVPPTPSDTSASAADADKERRPTDDELIDGIFWPNYDITSQPILFFNNVRSGFEMAESRARHANKSRLEFVCYNEEEVVCLTEEMTQGDYRLRMVLVVDQAVVQSLNITFAVVVHEGNTTTGTDAGSIYKHKNYTTRFVAISDSGENEATTPTELLTNSTASEAPQLPAECPCKNGGMCKLSNTNPPENYCECTVDFFGAHCETKKETITMLTLVTTEPAVNQSSAPHFEQDAYDVVVPEGKNNEASTAAIIKYMSSASGSRQPNFTITSDTLEWFEIGGILQIPNEEKLVYAITLKLRAGIEVNRTQSGITDGLYSFALEASEPPYLTVAPISAEILSLDTKAQTSTVASSASTASEELQTTAEVEGESSTAEVDAVSSTIEVEEESSAATSTSPTEEEATSSAIETLETITEEVPTESTATPTPASTEISTATGTFSFTVPSDLEIGSEPGLSIDISGEKNGRIMVSEGLNQDDYVPEFKVIVNLMDKSKQDINLRIPIELTTDSDAFFFKPRIVLAGRPAFLVVNNMDSLDYETDPTTFLLEITAQILGHPNTAIKRTLEVAKVDEVDTPPEFVEGSYSFSVLENSMTGTAVGRISATDKDQADAGKLTYVLFGEGNELFAIHDGAITVACPTALPCLDRENQTVYHLIAVAKDSAGLDSIPTEVVINIGDKNDNGPKIVTSTEHIAIAKGQLATPVLITITDKDIAPNDEALVTLDGSASAFFQIKRISTHDYRLKLAALPNPGDYTLIVFANDGSGTNNGDTRTISVSVRDTISKAHFRRVQYDRTVNSEKLVKGNPLVQLELEGIQRENVRFYAIKGSPGWLKIDPESGDISVGDVPAGGVPGGKHEITVAAVDHITGSELAETAFSLTVIGKRHGSVFLQPLFSVNVNTHTPQPQATISLVQPGQSIKLIIVPESIHAMDDRLKAVDVTPTVVSIVDGRALLMLPAEHHLRTVQFQVAPEDNLMDRALVTVYLSTKVEEMKAKMQEMSRPVFRSPWKEDRTVISIKLPEETLPGYTVISLPAHDPMSGLSVPELKLTGDMAKFFQVNQTTGDIIVTTQLDYERLSASEISFDLTLTAGTAPFTTEAVLKIEIIDIDDNAPRIQLMNETTDVTIPENTEGGKLVYALKVMDKDRHLSTKNNYMFELLGDGASNFQLKESNESLIVAVAPSADLDYESQHTINLVLTIKDSGKNTISVPLPINITDVNDNAPAFDQPMYTVQLVENWPVGATVIKTSATDADSGDNGRVTYTLQLNEDKYFSIDENTGEIRTARPLLNLARAEPYLLRVVATDNGEAQSTTGVDLRVSVLESTAVQARENSHLQLISPPVDFVLRIEENIPAERRVYTAVATYGDSDQPPSDIKYSLTTLDGDKLFDIDSSSGDLFTLTALDREHTAQVTAELNKTKAKQVCRSMDLLETSDHDCSFSSGRESGYYSVQQQSPCKEYASSECPSLSPLLSDDIKVYNDHSLPMFKLPLAKRLGPAGSARNAQIDVSIPDFESTAKFLIKSVNETKYVTAIFEATDGGIDVLIQDVLSEFQLWFEENGLLGIACEVHWSVPEKRRNRLVETRMKEGIHQALRKNNRKVMDLKNDKSRNLPLMLAESSTQENTFRQTTLNCFQGVYRRFYDTLLPYQHKETVEWHEPFWSLSTHKLPEPNPQQFLLGKCPNKLENTSLVAVIVTAESSIDPNNKVSRPLRIEIADADDNVPDFGQDQGSLPSVFTINAEDTTGWTNESMHVMIVGKVHAEDVDLPPFDVVNYYLLPHCDNEDGIFDINQTSGEIFVSAPLPEEHRATYQLCVLASPLANQTMITDVQFSSKNKSMIHVIVKVMKPMADTERDHRPTIQFMNNSIITMGSGFVDAMIPISAPIMGGKELKYELKDVAFKPAEAETNVTNSMNAFVVDPHTGDVRVAADLDGTSEGIYTLNLVAKEKATDADYAHLVAKVHHIHDSSRLKYVFEAPVDSLGSSLTHFTQAVQQTINQTNDQLHLVFDRPQVYHWKSPQRSSVCFHATNNDDVLLSKESVLTMLAGLAGNDSELTQVYLQYKVINIEMCESPVIAVDKDDQYQTQIFWWIFAVFLSILILSALTCYLCFLGRYKQYMIGMPKAEDQQTIAPKVQRPHMLAITNGPPEPHFLSKNNPLPFAGY